LADDTPSWKPQAFSYDVLDCQMGIRFPIAKLMDFANQAESLENDPNPFALVTLAHLQTRATRKDPQARFEAKWKLIQLLFRRGWARQSILDLLYVLDWMMKLPDYLSVQLWQNVETLEQEKRMAYVSSFERIATEKGMQEGMLQGMLQGEALALQKLLTKRFGAVAPAIAVQIEAADQSQIGVWFDRAIDAPSLDAVFGDTPPPPH